VQPAAADDLVFEVDADDAKAHERLHVVGHRVGCLGIGAFEVDTDRHLNTGHHALDGLQQRRHRQRLPVGIAE